MSYVYPAMRYRLDDTSRYKIVNNEQEDIALGDEWDDPASVRVANTGDEPHTEAKRGPGRPKKVR